MTKIKRTMLIMAMVALTGATACGQKKTTIENVKASQKTPVADAGKVSSRQLQDDLAQMLLVGFRGTMVDKNNHIYRDITEYRIGGVILFEYDGIEGKHGRNIESELQLQKLCTQLQEISKVPLFIGIDQEGGRVCRLGPKQGFPRIPSATEMAKGGSDTVRYYSELTAKTLHKVGINLNFAPCVDVDNKECPVIGKLGRSFGTQPEEIATMAMSWIEGHRKHQVMCCLKHFPGHGNSRGDTHKGLVNVSGLWTPEEMEPYRIVSEKGDAEMVMTAHVVNEAWGAEVPASLNKQVNEMLRNEIHFEGLVITDDLCMGAITKMYSYEKVLEMALNSGADILCLSNNGDKYDAELVPKTMKLLTKMVEEGAIDSSKIHASAEKIRKYKAKMQEK